MLRHLLFSALLVVSVLLSAPAIARDSSYTFTTINFPGLTGNTAPGGINDRGQIVGTYASNEMEIHGFLYDRGTFTTLDVPFPGVFRTEAYGINSRGQIVGSYFDDSGGHGFIFDKGIFTPLDAPFPGVTHSEAFGINERGQIVGRYTADSVFHGFLYSHGEFSIIDVPFPGAVSTSLSGINDNGQIVGIYWPENSYITGDVRAFLYEAGVFSTIEVPFPNASYITAGGINSRGQIAGGYFDTAGHGYLWLHHRREFVTIDVPLTLVYQGSTRNGRVELILGAKS